MSLRWEHEEEYFQIMDAIQRAKKKGDTHLLEQLQARIKVFDDMMWHSMTAYFTELAHYSSVVEALERTAAKLGIPFPNLGDADNNTGDGQFIFGVSDGIRSIQIWPMEDRGYYSIEIYQYSGENYEQRVCYKGQTTSLDEATSVLSRWFVERCPIDVLQAQFPWMPREPFQLSSPRMTLE